MDPDSTRLKFPGPQHPIKLTETELKNALNNAKSEKANFSGFVVNKSLEDF